MIKNVSREYTQKIIPISTQKYKDGGVVKKSVLDLTVKMISQKKVMSTTEVRYIDVTFFVKLCVLNIENDFFTRSYL